MHELVCSEWLIWRWFFYTYIIIIIICFVLEEKCGWRWWSFEWNEWVLRNFWSIEWWAVLWVNQCGQGIWRQGIGESQPMGSMFQCSFVFPIWSPIFLEKERGVIVMVFWIFSQTRRSWIHPLVRKIQSSILFFFWVSLYKAFRDRMSFFFSLPYNVFFHLMGPTMINPNPFAFFKSPRVAKPDLTHDQLNLNGYK